MRRLSIFILVLLMLPVYTVSAENSHIVKNSPDIVGQIDAGDQTQQGHEKDASATGYPYEAFWTMLSFLILLLVLMKFAWKPMLVALKSREEYISKQISDAEKARKKAEEVLSQYHDKLAASEQEGKEIIARHTKMAEQESKEITNDTKKELQQLREKLKSEIEYERQEAKNEFWSDAGDIVLQLGQEVLGKSMDQNDQDKLIDEAVLRLKKEQQTESKQDQE